MNRKENMRKSGMIAVLAALSLTGCARFNTVQTDISTDANGIVRTVTTRTSAGTLFDSDSALANLETSQTDKTQRTEVGSLNQSSTSEVVGTLNKILGDALIDALIKSSGVPAKP